jgi:hypothetical protein
MGRARHYSVYVIELSKDALNEGRFVKGNPDYVPGRPCVYVGMTGLDPDVRFDKHKAGIQHNIRSANNRAGLASTSSMAIPILRLDGYQNHPIAQSSLELMLGGLSSNTVKTQLKAATIKPDTHRQGDFLKLLLALASV